MRKVLLYYPAITSNFARRGGSTIATLGLAGELAKCSNRFAVAVCGELDGELPQIAGVEILCAPPLDNPGMGENFLQSFDVVIFTTHLKAFRSAKRPVNQRWILDLHCWHIEQPEAMRLGDFSALITRSDLHSKSILGAIGPISVPVHAVGSGYDPTIFFERTQPRDRAKIVFAGAVVPHKGLHVLLDAFRMLREMHHELTLDIYGSASMWHSDDQYEIALRRLSIPGVCFRGAVGQDVLADALRSAAVLALPSELESFGLVAVEAQACGCVPVVARAGGSEGTFLPGTSGISYAPNHPRVLAHALDLAIKFQDDLRQYGPDFVRTNFAIQSVARKVAKVIESV